MIIITIEPNVCHTIIVVWDAGKPDRVFVNGREVTA